MHTPLAKIALIIIICCLLTLIAGAEIERPAQPALPAAPPASSPTH